MHKIILIIKELFANLRIIFSVAKYESKASSQGHYLGLAWEILNPLIQVATYFLVFGIGLRQDREVGEGIPFLPWMLLGISCWFFMNRATLEASKSISKKIKLVSKMKFPVSIIPAISIVNLLKSYVVMTSIALILLISVGIRPSIYWFQYFYYFFALITFLYFLALLNSTITILVSDFQFILRSTMRILFYFSGAIWQIQPGGAFPDFFVRILQLNPFFYIIEGFRDTFLSRSFFWERGIPTLFFWTLTILIAIISSHLHLKFRSKFIDLT